MSTPALNEHDVIAWLRAECHRLSVDAIHLHACVAPDKHAGSIVFAFLGDTCKSADTISEAAQRIHAVPEIERARREADAAAERLRLAQERLARIEKPTTPATS